MKKPSQESDCHRSAYSWRCFVVCLNKDDTTSEIWDCSVFERQVVSDNISTLLPTWYSLVNEGSNKSAYRFYSEQQLTFVTPVSHGLINTTDCGSIERYGCGVWRQEPLSNDNYQRRNIQDRFGSKLFNNVDLHLSSQTSKQEHPA